MGLSLVLKEHQFILLVMHLRIVIDYKSCGGDNIVSIIFCLPETPIVGLERTSYTVDEDVGHVDVCALIINSENCPFQFPFDVRLSTRDDTAGTYIVLCI